jgi:hypothetical protein
MKTSLLRKRVYCDKEILQWPTYFLNILLTLRTCVNNFLAVCSRHAVDAFDVQKVQSYASAQLGGKRSAVRKGSKEKQDHNPYQSNQNQLSRRQFSKHYKNFNFISTDTINNSQTKNNTVPTLHLKI